MTTAIVFIIILGVLVFVHEFGHFILAKLNKIGVEEFAFGFPPRVFCRKRGETNYCINAIPLGGYVRLVGEEEKSSAKDSFTKQPIRARVLVIVAGVFMNFMLAGILFGITYSLGTSPIVSNPDTLPGKKDTKVAIAGLIDAGAAQKAGLTPSDVLIDFTSVEKLTEFTSANRGKEVILNYQRYQETKQVTLTLPDKEAPLGVEIVDMTTIKMPLWQGIYWGFIEAGRTARFMLVFLSDMVVGLFHGNTELANSVSGPVGIYKITGEAVKFGITMVLKIAALLSVNLALINILPLPALDGGKLLFIVLEKIFRKRVVREEIENTIHFIGFALLIFLMILITYRDIVR